MADRSPVFLGLARPPKYLGLPIGYLVVLATAIVIPFIWTKSLLFFALGAFLYPMVWFLADREPHFFELFRVSYGSVRNTRNRSNGGGDSYGV
ncbi:type IV secretion system protein VirB3 [Cognatishimia sp. MH4019]|uniref:type IV secretion system protein VirB3 n=1 Tax=Cognatishimia sp. MH4019 TaxID=2854030 RepID=UPI001CD45CC4|nr:VirB3 family type IV secretion system protein [Cognatishimia sp. MH4019]